MPNTTNLFGTNQKKEKHNILKYYWILFQERKKTELGFRKFALEMKEKREQSQACLAMPSAADIQRS